LLALLGAHHILHVSRIRVKIDILPFVRLGHEAGCLLLEVREYLDDCYSNVEYRTAQWRTQEFCLVDSTKSVEDRENGDMGGGSPLIRGSGGSCNLVQEISFHIVKFS